MKLNLDLPWNGYTPDAMAIVLGMRKNAQSLVARVAPEQETKRLEKRERMILEYYGKTVTGRPPDHKWVDYRDSPIYCEESGELIISPEFYDMVSAGLMGLPVKEYRERITNKKTQSRFFGQPHVSSSHADKEMAVKRVKDRMKNAGEWRHDIEIKLENDGAFDGEFIPTNEFETIMLFSKIDRALGFSPIRLKINRYPDAIYESEDGDRLFVEFEYRAKNFITHGHDVDKTDLVICWIHDADLPLPVIELQHAYNPKAITFDLTKIEVK